MTSPNRSRLLLITAGSAVAVLALAALLTNVFERRQEARNPFFRVVALSDTTQDPAVWGQNFPQEYDDYRRTTDQVRTRYGGSEGVPVTPTSVDPRSVVAQSRLEQDPRLQQMWAGYAFAADFREERGHAYMLIDQQFTGRQRVVKQPGACLNCHASMVVPWRQAGDGDLVRGFEKLNALPYDSAARNVAHPITCIDCHDPETMALRITRPAFMAGIKAAKASQGIPDYDVGTMATRQEMRSFVCGQCHVEYYFKGAEKRLTFPWDRGLTADSMVAYYEANGHKDWTHQRTGAAALKVQHPEFELWSQGIHARSGVTCADCHMPYKRVGAMKVSDHHVQSPMLNINRACQTCHKASEGELKARVEQIQDRTYQLRNIALDALMELIADIEAAARADSSAPALTEARKWQRQAQFYADFIEAENSMGFHAPGEAGRILGLSIDATRKGQNALKRLAVGGTP
ncbi:MAG: ammonia-forming cytochrome c nitrite reductase subunit c552 [Propionibacteriaceae bacterium]|nr:ammonia-forming cytochrome c nitrite reductase subunit c552 [Gemmatimonadota bacterium]MCC6498471.1 ammonia-forming cytochrome c nitrite reductase subunit c552 [Propionibacteriaceae bacterium]